MSIDSYSEFKKLGLHKKPVLVVGIIKNVANSLQIDISIISEALTDFSEIHWFLVESASTDSTVNLLPTLAKKVKNFKYKSVDVNPAHNFRTEIMASARNEYLLYIREQVNPTIFPYIVIADFNLLNNKLTRTAVISSWQRTDWDVVTANQSGRYYDIWALRHDLWSPNDCWQYHQFMKKYVKFPELVNTYSLRSRMLKIPKESDWIAVDSAFGGFAIYKSEFLMQHLCYLGKTQQNEMICEHIALNSHLKKIGAKIYINTSLINTHYTDHSHRMKIVPTVIRILKYTSVFKLLHFYKTRFLNL